MSRMTKEHILNALAKGMRFDGRKPEDFREITVEYGVTKSAEGSARVKIGDTEIIAGVKMGVETPYPDTQDKGNLMVNAELLPLSSPDFEPGPPGMEAIELARVVDRGIRESGAIDVKALCITEGEKVWSVMIDICTINSDGNLIDASALAAIAALKDAKFPKYEDEKIDYMEKTDKALPLKKEPVTVTVFKIDSQFIVDPTDEEEKNADARLTAAIIKDGTICAMQKGGDTPLNVDEIDKMLSLAQEKAKEIRSKL
ncbi:exosome complex protein Rrp42 [Candidatus Woesearchaeota archaeon]|nr:exosome complex protein Rrp42 [Candidatus Woesearchaeota archaeon]